MPAETTQSRVCGTICYECSAEPLAMFQFKFAPNARHARQNSGREAVVAIKRSADLPLKARSSSKDAEAPDH